MTELESLVTEQIKKYIQSPQLQKYSVTPSLISGKFLSLNRVFNFELTKKKLVYSPSGREDSALFSALYTRADGLMGVPRSAKSRCTSISYECGKICLGLRRRCHKGLSLKEDIERVSKIFTLVSSGKKVGTLKEKALSHLSESDQAKVQSRATKMQNSAEREKKASSLMEGRKAKAKAKESGGKLVKYKPETTIGKFAKFAANVSNAVKVATPKIKAATDKAVKVATPKIKAAGGKITAAMRKATQAAIYNALK